MTLDILIMVMFSILVYLVATSGRARKTNCEAGGKHKWVRKEYEGYYSVRCSKCQQGFENDHRETP